MRSREEFGKYLLLKKLTEDPLGETFRAGRVGGDGVEQVVLLRVFNGSAVDGAALARSIDERSDIQGKLKNPNIGSGVDLGEERGVPFVAYDYISGRNLETLLIQASNTNSPIPADHAMLIAERMSLALSVAAESRLGNQRLVHGFAVPHLVMISNEGETRVLGFEASAGLAAQASRFDAQITRYLAPEVVAGQAVERSDDVFTLGAVLFELLACQPLPSPAADGTYDDAIAGAQVAYDGNPLPAAVVDLLRRSLAPRGQRLTNAGDWHKALSGLMADAGHGATTFNLAFFMHNLFRNEIEQESQEIEEEKTMSLTAADLGMDRKEGAAGEAPAQADAAVPPPDDHGGEEEKRSNKALIGLLAAVILVAAVVGGWYFLAGGLGSEPEPDEPQTTQAPPPQLPEQPEPEPEPEGPTPEEIQAQLAEMIDARSEEMESKLRQQYDDRIRQLQSDLAEAQTAAERAAAEREKQRLEEERKVQEEAARLAAEQQAAEEAARQAAEEQQAADPATGDGAQPGAGGTAAAGQRAQQRPAPPPEPEPEPEPTVREGDLVSPGAGVRPPELLAPPEIRYPAMAKKLAKEADVEVRVLVDERGNVRTAELVGDRKAGFGFDQAALEAARSARFRPAQKEGVRVKMYFNLTIKFEL